LLISSDSTAEFKYSCNRQNEDGGHLFFGCKYAKYVWKAYDMEEVRAILAEKE
jgi:hypothetical protein